MSARPDHLLRQNVRQLPKPEMLRYTSKLNPSYNIPNSTINPSYYHLFPAVFCYMNRGLVTAFGDRAYGDVLLSDEEAGPGR